MKEKTLHRGVCDYIRLQYPGTMFNTDLSGAMTYTCPYCGYEMPEDEAESCCDCGCPSCRRYIDWEDYPNEIEDAEAHENIHEAL